MRAALYKEFKLTSPSLYFFALLGALVVIPNYPKIISMVYVIWEIGVYLQMKKESRDFEFSRILPVSEKFNIASVVLFIGFLEFLQIAVAALCAPLSVLFIQPAGSVAGLDLNLTFFGVAFLTFGAFNVTMIPLFYRRDKKMAIPIIVGGLIYASIYIIIEIVVNFAPGLSAILDSLDPSTFGRQSIVLIIGILAFAASLPGACKLACVKGSVNGLKP